MTPSDFLRELSPSFAPSSSRGDGFRTGVEVPLSLGCVLFRRSASSSTFTRLLSDAWSVLRSSRVMFLDWTTSSSSLCDRSFPIKDSILNELFARFECASKRLEVIARMIKNCLLDRNRRWWSSCIPHSQLAIAFKLEQTACERTKRRQIVLEGRCYADCWWAVLRRRGWAELSY